MAINSRAEGQQWIDQLENEAHKLQFDIVTASGVVSDVGMATLANGLEKTLETIEEIRLEMMLLDE